MALANGRKLESTDVRAIFESLHEGKPPPPDLEFSIVPVGPSGLRLSPPAHEFPGTINEQHHDNYSMLFNITNPLSFLLSLVLGIGYIIMLQMAYMCCYAQRARISNNNNVTPLRFRNI